MRDWKERLLDIKEAIAKAEKYAAFGQTRFQSDELLHTWIARQLQDIGEAVRTLPPELLNKYPEIPWKKIVGMRHIIVHQYFAIDAIQLWQVVNEDLPKLKDVVEKMLDFDADD